MEFKKEALIKYTSISAGVFLFSLAGVYSGNKIILLLLNFIIPYPLMIYLIKKKNIKNALFTMIFWAVILGFSMSLWCTLFPLKSEKSVIMGSKYREEMFNWIKTGIGTESNPAKFIPQHLTHLLIFTGASLLTIGFAGILFGIILMDYMAFYVGQLINSTNEWNTILMAWHPWSILRVIAFSILGVLITKLCLDLTEKRKYSPSGFELKAFTTAGILLIIDIVMKLFLAPIWQEILSSRLI